MKEGKRGVGVGREKRERLSLYKVLKSQRIKWGWLHVDIGWALGEKMKIRMGREGGCRERWRRERKSAS